MSRRFHLVNVATGEVLSRHLSFEDATEALHARHRRTARLLNRPGLHGGIDPGRYEPLGTPS
jgi:hypothetical protein